MKCQAGILTFCNPRWPELGSVFVHDRKGGLSWTSPRGICCCSDVTWHGLHVKRHSLLWSTSRMRREQPLTQHHLTDAMRLALDKWDPCRFPYEPVILYVNWQQHLVSLTYLDVWPTRPLVILSVANQTMWILSVAKQTMSQLSMGTRTMSLITGDFLFGKLEHVASYWWCFWTSTTHSIGISVGKI